MPENAVANDHYNATPQDDATIEVQITIGNASPDQCAFIAGRLRDDVKRAVEDFAPKGVTVDVVITSPRTL